MTSEPMTYKISPLESPKKEKEVATSSIMKSQKTKAASQMTRYTGKRGSV